MKARFLILALSVPFCFASIEQKMEAYILAHPEIIVEALERHKDNVFQQKLAQISQPGDYDIMLHEGSSKERLIAFVDYRCGACKNTAKYVDRFIKEHPGISLVLRPLPILGGESITAALMLYDAPDGEKYELHNALLAKRGSLDLAGLAKNYNIGLTQDQYDKHPAFKYLEKNYRQSMDLDNQSVPLYVLSIGEKAKVLNGLPSSRALEDAYQAIK